MFAITVRRFAKGKHSQKLVLMQHLCFHFLSVEISKIE